MPESTPIQAFFILTKEIICINTTNIFFDILALTLTNKKKGITYDKTPHPKEVTYCDSPYALLRTPVYSLSGSGQSS
jgi:hypothetical protein